MNQEFILEIKNLKKYFQAGRPGWSSKADHIVHAVDDINLQLKHGEVIALVGESGCGKSTLALTLMGLEEATEGHIFFNGRDVTHLNDKERKEIRRKIQMVFQDPYESLNPTQTIEEIIMEPLIVHNIANNYEERKKRVKQALEDSGLKPAETYMPRFPHQLSGGQRQRVVIASALVLEPELLVADEPVSMLDVSIRAEIINLLAELQKSRNISVIFITHDLGTVGFFANRVAVMYLGRIIEIGSMNDVLKNTKHPYSQALLSVIPVPNPRLRKKRIILQGETPNPIDLPSGCRFHPRCPIVQPQCKQNDPQFVNISATHQAACLLLEK